MIALIGLGVGGLLWLAQKGVPGERPASPAMSDALWRMLLEVLRTDVAPDKLDLLAEAFGRAHHHHAQQLLMARAAQARERAARNQRIEELLEGPLAAEHDPAMLDALADVLALIDHPQAAARVRALAASAARRGDDLSELLGGARNGAGHHPADDDDAEMDEDLDADAAEADGADGAAAVAVEPGDIPPDPAPVSDGANAAAKPTDAARASEVTRGDDNGF